MDTDAMICAARRDARNATQDRRELREEIVQMFTRILETKREPEDQARQLVTALLLNFEIERSVIR